MDHNVKSATLLYGGACARIHALLGYNQLLLVSVT